MRSLLAEFLVARAVGAAARPRVEWDAYDVTTPSGHHLEVKAGAYLQAWDQSGPSKIAFAGLRARTWAPQRGYSAEKSYNADAYVFAVITGTEHARYDALDTAQWSFWVLPRRVLEQTGQASIRLRRVQALAGSAVPYADLAARVHDVLNGTE